MTWREYRERHLSHAEAERLARDDPLEWWRREAELLTREALLLWTVTRMTR